MNFKRYRDAIIVLLALAVPFWFLRYSMKEDPRQLSGPDKLIVRGNTPIQYAAATLARGLSGIWTDYIYLVDVKEDNAKLAAENARLDARVRKLEGLEEQNRRLRGLLGLRNDLTADVVSAEVIAKERVKMPVVGQVANGDPVVNADVVALDPLAMLQGNAREAERVVEGRLPEPKRDVQDRVHAAVEDVGRVSSAARDCAQVQVGRTDSGSQRERGGQVPCGAPFSGTQDDAAP